MENICATLRVASGGFSIGQALPMCLEPDFD
jgi:hypothetical protein